MLNVNRTDTVLYRLCGYACKDKIYSLIPFSFYLRNAFFNIIDNASNIEELMKLIISDKNLNMVFSNEDIINKLKKESNSQLIKNCLATYELLISEIFTLRKNERKITYIHKDVEQIAKVSGYSVIYKYNIPYFITFPNAPDIIPLFNVDITDPLSFYEPISYIRNIIALDNKPKVLSLKLIFIDPCNKYVSIRTVNEFIEDIKEKQYIERMTEGILKNILREEFCLTYDLILCNRCENYNCIRRHNDR